MDTLHRELIREKLPELLDTTRCSSKFLSNFVSDNLFSSSDVELIEAERGRSYQSKLFYDILVTRSDSYSTLLRALRDTRQTGALAIFEPSPSSSSSSSTQDETHIETFGFTRPPHYMSKFLSDGSNRTLVVCTADCEITCGRISDTSEDCEVLSLDAFTNQVSSPEMTRKTVSLLIINCRHELVTHLNYDACKKMKLVFVTSKSTTDTNKFLKDHKIPSKTIKSKIQEEIFKWNDLTIALQRQIKRFIEVVYELETENFSHVLEKLDSRTLLEFIKGEKPELFDETLPTGINYYVPRRIRGRKIVSHNIFRNIKKELLQTIANYMYNKSMDDIIKNIKEHIFKHTKYDFLKNMRVDMLRATTTKDDMFNIFKDYIKENIKEDIFCFQNIKRHVLTDMTIERVTESSSDLLRHKTLKCRFVALELKIHFEKIHSTFTSHPIHLLRYEEDKFIWEKSYGALDNLQDALEEEDNQQVVGETDFLKQTKSVSRTSSYPICISDTPGMGKSVLLAQLGRELKKELRHGHIVAFVEINDLVKRIKKALNHKRDQESIREQSEMVLIKYIAKNVIGEISLQLKKDLLKELLLDGFDEISPGDVGLAYSCIDAIQGRFQYTRIWITTRPHMFLEMESKFGVLGYNIVAFEEEDQINFLKSYWLPNSLEDAHSAKMRTFAQTCLKSIKSTFDFGEEDIAGIPLQCQLIGDVFEDNAKAYCFSTEDNVTEFVDWSPGGVKTMLSLYQMLVDNKLEKFRKRYGGTDIDIDHVLKAHYDMALSLLFPSFAKKFRPQLSNPLEQDHLFDVGFFESKSFDQIPRFIHRTFAEYFLADFIVEFLYSKCSSTLLQLLYNHVLETEPTQKKFRDLTIPARQFKYAVVCYFIDALLAKDDPNWEPKIHVCYCFGLPGLGKIGILKPCSGQSSFEDHKKRDFPINSSLLKKTAEACASSNMQHIFTKLVVVDTGIFAGILLPSSIYTKNFVILATMWSNSSMVQMACKKYMSSSAGKSLKNIWLEKYSLVHLAVIRGDYGTVELLLSQDDSLKSDFMYLTSFYKNLLSECVKYSKFEEDRIISNKKQIINHLFKLNRDLFIEDKAALLGPDVSIDLVTEVLQCAANNVYEQEIDLLLDVIHHYTSKCGSSEQYQEIIKIVLRGKQENVKTHLLNAAHNDFTLIRKVLEGLDPDTNLLKFLNDSGLTLHVMNLKPSLLNLAIQHKRGQECIRWLLQNTKTTRDELKDNIFDAITHSSCQAVQVLLESRYKLGPNIKNRQGKTMMHELFSLDKILSADDVTMVKVLCSKNINIDIPDASSQTPIDNLTKTVFSTHGLEIFGFLESLGKLQPAKCNFLKIKWFLHNVSNLDEDKFRDLVEKHLGLANTVKMRDSDQNSLLHLAASIGHTDAIRVLLRKGSLVNAVNGDNNTPLHLLALSKKFRLEAWRLLVQSGGDAVKFNKNLKNSNNYTPICFLAFKNRAHCLDAVQYVLGKLTGRDLTKIEQIVLNVIWRCPLDTVTKICDWYGTHYKPLNEVTVNFAGHMATPLYTALLSYDIGVLEYVSGKLRCTASPTPPPDTCIHTYIQTADVDVADRLKFIRLVTKLFPHLIKRRDERGKVPLALRGIDPALVKPLCRMGAMVDAVDSHKNTPLHWAIKHNPPRANELVRELIESGADVNAENGRHQTPLLLTLDMANKNEIQACIKILVLRGANTSRKYYLGKTFLHILPSKIIPSGYHDIVEFFLENKLAHLFQLRCDKNFTPDQSAMKYFELEHRTVELFKQHGIFVKRGSNIYTNII